MRVGYCDLHLGRSDEENGPASRSNRRTAVCGEVATIFHDDDPVAIEQACIHTEDDGPKVEHALLERPPQVLRNRDHIQSMHTGMGRARASRQTHASES